MNEDDHRRLVKLWCDAVHEAERLTHGGLVIVTIAMQPNGHVARRESTVEVKRFPLDLRRAESRS
jgi:hypothetical protein